MERHIHLHRNGPKDAPALIFLHGWTMGGAIFAPAMAAMPGFRCLAPDLPGHGGTRGYPVSVAGAAQMLSDLLAQEAPGGGAVLVGWSLGALVGWAHLARAGGAGVAGMVSLDMSPRPLPAPGWVLGLNGQSADDARAKTAWFRHDWPRAAQTIARTMFASDGGAPDLPVAQVQALIRKQPPEVMASMWESLVECDLRAAIAALPVPLLAIHGAQSRVYPPQTAHWLAETAPQGQALVLPGAGHSPILEQPRTCLAAIAAFAANPATAPKIEPEHPA